MHTNLSVHPRSDRPKRGLDELLLAKFHTQTQREHNSVCF